MQLLISRFSGQRTLLMVKVCNKLWFAGQGVIILRVDYIQ